MLPSSSVKIPRISSNDLEIMWEFLEGFRLGRGGFANVFHVFYRGSDAVLKKMGNQDQEEMLREAQVVASLQNCQNVIRIYGICDESPYNGMIMEFCAGPNLAELVLQLHHLEVNIETLRIFKWCHELTRALYHLNITHYHGDLTPKNVFVKERPCCCKEAKYENVIVRDTPYHLCTTCKGVHLEHVTLKIGDFGNSFTHGTPRKYAGTLKFNAPETTKTGEYTEKSEVFSFGLLMLTLVLGKPTDQCTEEHGKFLAVRNARSFEMSKCSSNSISETITECTHINPEHRPNFKQLLEMLNARYDHYASLRGADSRKKANRERMEFLDHYKMFPRKITMAHRTTTTSTFLSSSTSTSQSTLNMDMETGEVHFYGGPIENDVFINDSPFTSRKNSGDETSRSYVENPMYTDDEWVPRQKKSTDFDYGEILIEERSYF